MWALLAAAASYCSDLGRIHLEIRPLHVLPPSQLGFQPTAAYYIHQLELSESADNVFARFSKGSVQRKITKAEHEDLTCEEGNSQKLIEAFYGLLLLTRRRHRIPPQPIEWFQSLARLLGDAFKVRVAFKSGRPVASIITLQSTQSMVYKYGCSDEAYWNLGGLQLLLWKAIQQAVSHGCKHFDFGRSDVDHIGLVEFKDRWGAKRTLLSYWTTPSTNETRRDAMDSLLARRAFSLVPDRILVVLGRMLYRYIG
ncbi:MAG: GNAT family N-acetyltransferase [Acidobacteria bacterium]|nr:GNAT family N-acetyltransferase [Acidobacteriota bacterium]